MCVSGTGIFEDQKVDPEGEHVDEQGEEYESQSARCPVSCVFDLLSTVFMKRRTFGMERSPNLVHRSSIV